MSTTRMRCVRTRIVSCSDASADALCPVPCAATFSPRSRAKSTTATTSATVSGSATATGRWSTWRFQAWRASSQAAIALDRDRARELPAQRAEVGSPPVRQVLDMANHLEAPPFSFRRYEWREGPRRRDIPSARRSVNVTSIRRCGHRRGAGSSWPVRVVRRSSDLASPWPGIAAEPAAPVPRQGRGQPRRARPEHALRDGSDGAILASALVRGLLSAAGALNLVAIPRRPSDPEPGKFTHYALEATGDEQLTEWMRSHLRIAVWPAPQGTVLKPVEAAVIGQWLPPLNLTGVKTPWTTQVKAARAS